MKPVMQTVFTQADQNIWGNCFNACVASILEIGIDEVPVIDAGDQTDNTGAWLRKLNEWLRGRGLGYFEINSLPPDDYAHFNLDTYHIIVGPSPRGGGNHAVVGLTGKIVHDPHPDNTGLADGAWLHGLFLKTSRPNKE